MKELVGGARNSRKIAALAFGVAALCFSGWLYLSRPNHKYRLTVEVETPQGVRSASNVMAVYQGKISVGAMGGGTSLKGEALFVDLGEGRNLIAALVHGRDGSYVDGVNYLALNAFKAAGNDITTFSDLRRLAGSVPVTGDLIPTFLTFADLSDSRTARVVAPEGLSSTFGPGYRLRGVTLKLMSVGCWPFDFGGVLGEPVTRGIEEKLRWWQLPGRPSAVALRAAGLVTGSSIEAEFAFKRS